MSNHYQILIIDGGNDAGSVASLLLQKRSSLKIEIVTQPKNIF